MAPYEETLLPEEEIELNAIASLPNQKKRYEGLIKKFNASNNAAEIAFIARLLKESIGRDLNAQNQRGLKIHPDLATSVHRALKLKLVSLEKSRLLVPEHRELLLSAFDDANLLFKALKGRKMRVDDYLRSRKLRDI